MIYIVGIGPGHRDYILPKATKILNKMNFIIGFKRALESLDFIDVPKFEVNKLKEIIEFLNNNKDKDIAVVASGDPLFYGISNYLKNNFDGDIQVITGISSFQYFMEKLNKSWNGAYLGSLHGREEEFLYKVKENKVSIWLTDNVNTPSRLAKKLLNNNLNCCMYVGESLSYDNERIVIEKAEELIDYKFSNLCVLVVENEEFIKEDKELRFIKDSEFIRDDAPMTKEEVRILSVAKLNLNKDSKVLDVGAGTGSISVQAAKICSLGKVTSIEKEEHAIDTINKNVAKFELKNLKVIKGEATEVYDLIEDEFDSIFIGGSGGNIEEIIGLYEKKLKHQGKIVLNFITINNLFKTMDTLKKLNYKVRCTQVNISKTLGQTYMLKASNPIFIVEGEKNDG